MLLGFLLKIVTTQEVTIFGRNSERNTSGPEITSVEDYGITLGVIPVLYKKVLGGSLQDVLLQFLQFLEISSIVSPGIDAGFFPGTFLKGSRGISLEVLPEIFFFGVAPWTSPWKIVQEGPLEKL